MHINQTYAFIIDVEKIYKARPDYNEGIAEIYDALAARALGDLRRCREKSATITQEEEELGKKVVDFLRKSEDHIRLNEYTWLIKGFYEMQQGNTICCTPKNKNLLKCFTC